MKEVQKFKIRKFRSLKDSMLKDIEGPYGKWIKYPRTLSNNENERLKHITEEKIL